MLEEFLSPAGGNSKTETLVICIFFLLSSALYVVTGSIGLSRFNSKGFFMTIQNIGLIFSDIFYANGADPILQMENTLFYIFFIAAFACAAGLFIIILLKGILKRSSIYDSLFSNYTRFIPIPLILTSALFLFNCFIDSIDNTEFIVASIISGISLMFSLYIFWKTSMKEFYLGFFVKKCFITSLIAVNLYCFCYSVAYSSLTNVEISKIPKTKYNLAITFGVAFGVATLLQMFFQNDMVMGVFALFVYIGILISYSHAKKNFGSFKQFKTSQGIISGCFIGGIALLMTFCILKGKKKVMESN